MRNLPIAIEYVSPSAIETFCDCPRKWAHVKLGGAPKRQSKAAQLGSDVHGQHEAWLRDGIPYDRTTRAGWSVVVRGRLEEVTTFDASLCRAFELPASATDEFFSNRGLSY